MSKSIVVEAADTDASLDLTIDQEGVGGVTGKSPTVALRDASTADSYLDWNDMTFKTSGWTTRLGTMTEVDANGTNEGHYRRALDVSSVVGVASGDIWLAEYQVDDGGDVIGATHDLIMVVDNVTDVPTASGVEVSCESALDDRRVSELVYAAATGNPAADSFMHQIMSPTTPAFTYTQSTDALGAISDSVGALNDVSTGDIFAQAGGAIDARRLDELVAFASANPVTGSFFELIMNKVSGGFGFDQTADSLEAVADAVAAVPDAAAINAEVDTALADIRLDELVQNAAAPATPTIGAFFDLVMRTAAGTFDRSTDSLEALGAGVAAVPDAAAINAEVDTALADIRLDEVVAVVSANPVTGSFFELMMNKVSGGFGFDQTTDSLEALSDATPTVDYNAIADAVLQEVVADHIGVPGSLAAVVDEINTDVDTVLASGVQLNATGLLGVNAEVDTALSDIRLDELIAVTSGAVDAAAGAFLDLIMSKDVGQTFDRSTDSLEAIADGGGGASPAAIADAVLEELIADHQAVVGSLAAFINEIQTDVNTVLASGVELNGTGQSQVNTEVDTAIADARLDELLAAVSSGNPTGGSYFDLVLNKDGSFGFDRTTDSLEAISDDTVAIDVNAIADAVLRESVPDHEAVADSLAEYIAAIRTDSAAVPSAAVIADAVLREIVGDHEAVSGSLADLTRDTNTEVVEANYRAAPA